MRKLFAFGILGMILVSGHWCAGGEVAVEATPGIPIAKVEAAGEQPFQFKVQYWRSNGTAMFRNVGFDPDVGPWESQLEYPMDGDFIVFGAEYAFQAGKSRFALDLNYGFSEDIEGTTRDWDWLWYDPQPLVYAESDTDADSDFLTANLYYRLWGWRRKNSLDVFVGYHQQENSFSNSNVRLRSPQYFTAAGKVAEYEMDFKGVRAGLRTEVALSRRFALRGNLALIPYADFDASGNWLLRDLSFSQSADGYGLDFDFSLDFEVARNVDLLVGVKYLYLRAADGEEWGSVQGVPYGPGRVVDEVESDQFGGTAGVLLKF